MTQNLSIVGIDIAKNVFHLVGMDECGKIILRKRLIRGEVLAFMSILPAVTVGMEAYGSAHYWARRLREHGHTVKLMAPQDVKPYVKTNKNSCGQVQYETIAVLPDFLPGHQKHFLKKVLAR